MLNFLQGNPVEEGHRAKTFAIFGIIDMIPLSRSLIHSSTESSSLWLSRAPEGQERCLTRQTSYGGFSGSVTSMRSPSPFTC